MIQHLEEEHRALEEEMTTLEAEESVLVTLDQTPFDLSAIQVMNTI